MMRRLPKTLITAAILATAPASLALAQYQNYGYAPGYAQPYAQPAYGAEYRPACGGWNLPPCQTPEEAARADAATRAIEKATGGPSGGAFATGLGQTWGTTVDRPQRGAAPPAYYYGSSTPPAYGSPPPVPVYPQPSYGYR